MMEIEYSAYYKTDSGHHRVINGVLDDYDIQEAIKKKEDRDSIGHINVTFQSASYDRIEL